MRMVRDMIRRHATLLVVAAYVVVATSPFVFAATHASFWTHQDAREPIAGALFGLLVIALVMRQRWAWFVLVAFNGFVVISYIWEWTHPSAFAIDVVALALLVSPTMRKYVRGSASDRARGSARLRSGSVDG
jgi:hypothetical protein